MQPSLPSDGAPIPTVETAVKLGLLPDEFDLIVRDMNDEDKVRKEKDRVTRQTIFKNWYIKNRRNKSS